MSKSHTKFGWISSNGLGRNYLREHHRQRYRWTEAITISLMLFFKKSLRIIKRMVLILKLLISLFWVENVFVPPKKQVSMIRKHHNHTLQTQAPTRGTMKKSHRTLTITRHQRDKQIAQRATIVHLGASIMFGDNIIYDAQRKVTLNLKQ